MFRLAKAITLALALAACGAAGADEPARVLPAPRADMPAPTSAAQTAVFAGGCFWGLEGVFEHVRGVTRVRSGYAGGRTADPSYEEVSTGGTGHAEAVEITYDPRVVSYGTLLRVFFSVATDPTQLNRQGPDHGTQYRSNIFAADADQQRVAAAYIAQLGQARAFANPIVTRVDRLTRFYPAEAYHQDYLSRHPAQPYIVVNDLPKVANLQRFFPELYSQARAA